MKILIAMMLALGFALPSWAIPTISCHCFQERSYDPARPAAADDYFLASTQNSLLATVFDFPKRDVVKAKMASGVSGEDLWVIQYLNSNLGLDPDKLTASRKRFGSWAEVLEALQVDTAQLPRAVADAFGGRVADNAIAAAVVDEILVTRLGMASEIISRLRSQNYNSKEVILASFLGCKSGESPVDMAAAVRSGGQSWGALLNHHRIEPSQIETLLKQQISPRTMNKRG